MLQLFQNDELRLMARPAPVRSGLWSIIIHGTAILFLLSLGFSPVIQQLPEHINLVLMAPPLPPPPPPPSAPRTTTVVPVKRTVRIFNAKLTAPAVIPASTSLGDIVSEAPPDIGVIAEAVPGGIPGGIPGGVTGGVLTGVLGGIPAMGLPPPPPPPPVAKVERPPESRPPQRIQVNSQLQEGKILKRVQPVYPRLAKQTHIEGTVCLKAIIDREGRVTELKVVEGHVLLAPAAREAVQKWLYRPTVLNGEAVEVESDIIVTFYLM